MAKEETLKARKYIKEGLKYIYPQKKKDWEGYVKIAVADVHWAGLDIQIALNSMKELEGDKNEFEVAKDVVKETSSSAILFSKTAYVVTTFAKKGPNFYRAIMKVKGKDIEAEDEHLLKEIEKENKKFEKEIEEANLTEKV